VDYHTFLLAFKYHRFKTSSFSPTFINQVIVVNKDHCSSRSEYQSTNPNRGGINSSKMSKGRNASKKIGNHCFKHYMIPSQHVCVTFNHVASSKSKKY